VTPFEPGDDDEGPTTRDVLLALRRPLLFLIWIVGSLFAVPLAFRGLGAPPGVAIATSGACFVGPLAIAAGRGGAVRGRGNQRTDIVVAVAWDAIAFGAAAYLLLTHRPWLALVIFYTGVLVLGVLFARVRSR